MDLVRNNVILVHYQNLVTQQQIENEGVVRSLFLLLKRFKAIAWREN